MSKLFLILTLSFLGSAQAAEHPSQTVVDLNRVYVPIGFDDNDLAQVVVVGEMPDTCHRVGPYRVERKGSDITLRQTAYRYEGPCVRLKVQFVQLVDLGLLPKGTYKLTDASTRAKLGELPVVAAPSAKADDFLYAPVAEAIVTREGDKASVYLAGTFASSCLKLKEVKVTYGTDVVVVQPIAEKVGKDADCKPGRYRFSRTVPLVNQMKEDWLLHVRTMNGQAINKVQDLPL